VRTGSPQVTPPQDRESLPTCVNGLEPLPVGYWEAIRAGLPAITGGWRSGSGSGSASPRLNCRQSATTSACSWPGMGQST
jgi:hypothetical protein